jgi:tRNA/rRNA methyltransferase
MDGGDPLTGAELDRLAGLLGEVLAVSGYVRHHPANTGEAELRRLVRRMGADARTAPVWMGIFRQVLWKLRVQAGAAGQAASAAGEDA